MAAMDSRTRKRYDQARKANIEAYPVDTFQYRAARRHLLVHPHVGTIPSGGMSLCQHNKIERLTLSMGAEWL